MKVIVENHPTTTVVYCCDQLKEAHLNRAIVLPVTFELNAAWIFGVFDSGKGRRQFEIKFCPFCGTRILFTKES